LHDKQGDSGLYSINILRISGFPFYHFHFNRFISDNALIFGNRVFYFYHHYGHNTPILINRLKYSDFNNYIKPVLISRLKYADFNSYIKPVLFIYTFVVYHEFIIIFLLELHSLYSNSNARKRKPSFRR